MVLLYLKFMRLNVHISAENARLKQQMLQYTESLSKLEERLKALEQTSN